jgi:hypothetical protein
MEVADEKRMSEALMCVEKVLPQSQLTSGWSKRAKHDAAHLEHAL